MSAHAAAPSAVPRSRAEPRRRAAPRFLASRYRQVRAAHPVEVLRWLRNGMLLGIAAAAVLYLWVALQARGDISTARQTANATAYIGHAESYVSKANAALGAVLANNEDVQLTGTGSEYVTDVSDVLRYLTLAAESNGAGEDGTFDIQFAQDQLQNYLQQSEDAVVDDEFEPGFGAVADSYVSTDENALQAALGSLEMSESKALGAQRDAWPLDPAVFWWVLLGPVIIVLILAGATARVLARHFRRRAGPWLWGSLLVTIATAVTAGFFNLSDERHLSADPWAGHPVTLTCALLLFAVAFALAYLAYRPRLAEYRFESS
jgi:hypothetical protein